MNSYVAFLRGINVGGHKPVKMDALKKAIEGMGYKKVKTILASGNVVFEGKAGEKEMAAKIEKKLAATFGHEIGVVVRTMEELRKLEKMEPFKGIEVTTATRLYVTFLAETPKSTLKLPYVLPAKDFTILRRSETEICSVLVLLPDGGTVKAMAILEKEFGKRITTRNWNTVMRILKG